MVSSSRLLPLATLGLLLPLSACVTAPRNSALNTPSAYRYCDPYAVSSGIYGRCYSGLSRFDYVGYGGYYGGYGYPQAYSTAAPLYGAYGFNRGRGGVGSYYFNDGYHFASPFEHGHGDFGSAHISSVSSGLYGHFGQGAGHYGSYGGLHNDIGSHSGSPHHTSGIRHGGAVGHSRPSHGSRHH